jgi:hypothetical protein
MKILLLWYIQCTKSAKRQHETILFLSDFLRLSKSNLVEMNNCVLFVTILLNCHFSKCYLIYGSTLFSIARRSSKKGQKWHYKRTYFKQWLQKFTLFGDAILLLKTFMWREHCLLYSPFIRFLLVAGNRTCDLAIQFTALHCFFLYT